MRNIKFIFALALVFIFVAGCSTTQYRKGILPNEYNGYNGEFGLYDYSDENKHAENMCKDSGGLESGPFFLESSNGGRYYKYKCSGPGLFDSTASSKDSSKPKEKLLWCASRGIYTDGLCPQESRKNIVSIKVNPQAQQGISYVYCAILQRMVMEGKDACPDVAAQATSTQTPALAPKEKDSVQNLKERLKEAEAQEAADKRNKTLEAKQAVVREVAEKLAQKQAEAERQRAEKAESDRLAAEAKRGDGSSGDIHCKAMKLAPTTPKYLTCRKDFAETEEIARVAEQQKRREAEETQRAMEQAQRAAEQAKVGDGTPEHQACLKFGFVGGTPPYADCRLRLEMNKQEAARRQGAYEAEQQRYQEQLAAAKKEKERQRALAFIRYGAALASSTSPTLGGGLADANRAMGWAPPEPPQLQPFTIQGPKGMTTCTVVGNMYNCF